MDRITKVASSDEGLTVKRLVDAETVYARYEAATYCNGIAVVQLSYLGKEYALYDCCNFRFQRSLW